MDSQDDKFFHLFNIFISIWSNIEKKYVNACKSVYWHNWRKWTSNRKKMRTMKLSISSKVCVEDKEIFFCVFDDFWCTALLSTLPFQVDEGPWSAPTEISLTGILPRCNSLLIKPDTPKHKIEALPGKCMCSLRHALGLHREKQWTSTDETLIPCLTQRTVLEWHCSYNFIVYLHNR